MSPTTTMDETKLGLFGVMVFLAIVFFCLMSVVIYKCCFGSGGGVDGGASDIGSTVSSFSEPVVVLPRERDKKRPITKAIRTRDTSGGGGYGNFLNTNITVRSISQYLQRA